MTIEHQIIQTRLTGPLTAGAIRTALEHAPDHAAVTHDHYRDITTYTATWPPGQIPSSHLAGCGCQTCAPDDVTAPTTAHSFSDPECEYHDDGQDLRLSAARPEDGPHLWRVDQS
jgi:hypothetical protein